MTQAIAERRGETKKGTFPFEGIPATMDGSEAVVAVEQLASTGAAAYPITPSTNMGVGFEQAVANGQKNAWGETLVFIEPESEHSAASICEGYALAGGRVSTFTAGQGLLLMKEVLYVIAGKRLPVVFHIAARAMTVHSLNVHAGHDDVMGVADCGWGMIFARNAQEAGDFALIARRTAELGRTPYFNIQDGFQTSHAVQTMLAPEAELVRTFLLSPEEGLVNFMDTERPMMIGTVQNQDSYMRGKVAQRAYYRALPAVLEGSFNAFYELTGRRYGTIDSYKMDDAEYAIVGMGSFMETAMSTVDWIRKNRGVKVGVVSVISYRPFPAAALVEALRNVKVISILERCDESSAPDNPLTRDIKSAFADALWGHPDLPAISRIPMMQSGAGGLGGRDVRAGDILAIVENMKKGRRGIFRYCVGISHDDALEWPEPEPDIRTPNSFSLIGFSIGGFGSVTTNKIIASVCADLFGKKVQAFPKYGAEKKGLPTNYYLTVADEEIRFHQELRFVDLVVVNDLNAFRRENPLGSLKSGGLVIIQARAESKEDVLKLLPESTIAIMKEKGLKVYALDAEKIAAAEASSPHLQLRMQGIILLGAFLKVTPFGRDSALTDEAMKASIEEVIRKYFGKRGEKVVQVNLACVKRGFEEVREIL